MKRMLTKNYRIKYDLAARMQRNEIRATIHYPIGPSGKSLRRKSNLDVLPYFSLM